jgi:hypothetical protein
MQMPQRRGRGRPPKNTDKGSVSSIPESPPPNSGVTQSQWDALSDSGKLAILQRSDYDDGIPSRVPVPEEGRSPAVIVEKKFVPILGGSAEDMVEINSAGLMENALGKIQKAAEGTADPLANRLYLEAFTSILKKNKGGGPLGADAARKRARDLTQLIERLSAEDADFSEFMEPSCECLPDPRIVESRDPPKHFRRICRDCGFIWASLHCVHDSEQTPCPGCLKTPIQEEIA